MEGIFCLTVGNNVPMNTRYLTNSRLRFEVIILLKQRIQIKSICHQTGSEQPWTVLHKLENLFEHLCSGGNPIKISSLKRLN